MTAALQSLLSPHQVVIAGLSADAAKHGQRVLVNMRRVGIGIMTFSSAFVALRSRVATG